MVILDKLLKDLKSKLPSKKKSAEEEEGEELHEDVTDPSRQSDETDIADADEIEGEEEPVSLVDKLKAKFAKKSSSKDDDEDEDEEEESPKKTAKKKIGPIHIIAILAIGYFAAEEFLLPKEDESAAPQTSSAEEAIKRKAEERRKAKEAAKKANEATDTETAATDAEAPVVPPSDIPVEEPTPAITETPVETPVETPAETVTEAPVEGPTDIADMPDLTPIETIPSETGVSESKDTIDGVATEDGDENLTDKILQDLEKQANKSDVKNNKKEYVAPPDYEFKGRGLVYNCVGKHWACIDAPSYKVCESNASSTKTLGKSQECYPFNVYDNAKGCQNVQNRMVSSSAKTSFCNE